MWQEKPRNLPTLLLITSSSTRTSSIGTRNSEAQSTDRNLRMGLFSPMEIAGMDAED
jgi:hypothetical protein